MDKVGIIKFDSLYHGISPDEQVYIVAAIQDEDTWRVLVKDIWLENDSTQFSLLILREYIIIDTYSINDSAIEYVVSGKYPVGGLHMC